MTNTTPYKFEIPPKKISIIKVIGVGGGGSNAVNHMFNRGIHDVEFVIANTDLQALNSSLVPNKLQLGTNLMQGLGAGANPEKGKQAASESEKLIRDLLNENTQMVFITAGMGGGTGTGAAPVIAKIAKELELLTIGIVTTPFIFEGRTKMSYAEAGIKALKENSDCVLVILNEKLKDVYNDLSVSNAFAHANNILTISAKAIAEIITVPSDVNVDFQDVKTVMQNSGAAIMGSVDVEGEGRAKKAAEEVLSSPLLSTTDISGAKHILLNIRTGNKPELSIGELDEITDHIRSQAGKDAELIYGQGTDDDLGGFVRVTLIATGFEEKLTTQLEQEDERKVIDLNSNKPVQKKKTQPSVMDPESKYLKKKHEQQNLPPQESKTTSKNDDDKNLYFDTPSNLVDHKVVKKENEEKRPKEYHFELNSNINRSFKSDKRINPKDIRPYSSYSKDEKEELETPAYQRENIKLDKGSHSSEKNISRYNLNNDSHVLGSNRFLHDNVD